MKKVLQLFHKNEYLKSISTLMTGTGIAQIIPIISAPILTRVYSSYDFGVYAIFYSTYTILVSIGTLRYEMAIFLPHETKKTINLLALCFVICLTMSLVVLIILSLISILQIDILNLNILGKWIYLLPLVVFIASMYNVLNIWFLRIKAYKFLAKNKIILAFSTAIIQISLGFLRLDWFGLIFANVFGQVLALTLLSYKFFTPNFSLLHFISIKGIKRNIYDYKKFPIFSMPSGFINNISSQLPVFFISTFFGKNILGFYSMGIKVISLPLSFLGNSIGDVYRQQASRDFIENGNSKRIYIKTLKLLSFLSLIGFLLIVTLSPTFFSFILGKQWEFSGELVQITGLFIMIQFISSPLSFMILIAGKHQYDFVWQLFLIAFTGGSFYFGHLHQYSIKETLAIYSVSLSILYLLNIFISYKFSEK